VLVRRLSLSLILAFAATAALAANPTPVILSLSPQAAVAGQGALTLTVNGANFVSGAQIRVGTSTRTTTFISSTQVSTQLFAGDVQNAGSSQITVVNPGTPASSALTFTVYPNDPQITSLDPSSVPLNTTTSTVTVNGANFASTATVRVNNTSRSTAYVSSTQLTFALSSTDLSHTGTLQVTVANPNNKLSAATPLTITAASTVPTITSLSPSPVQANSGAFTLSVVGTNFVSGSRVKANGAFRTTTFVDAQHLTAQMLASDVASAGSISIVVNNPNGEASVASTLTVSSATAPTITTISPTSVTVGAPPFTLTITGTNFTSNATVTVGTAPPRSATFVDAQHLRVQIATFDVNTAGQVPITVTTPGTTGGTSNQILLFVTNNNAPVITALNPTTITTNPASLKVLINGSGYLLDDVALVNGTQRPTEYISATQLAVTLLASDATTPQTLAISVRRHDNSATSAPATLTVVSGAVPAITSVSPQQGTVGATQPIIAVFGQNFSADSFVTVDGDARPTTFISPTELHVTLSATDLATAHDVLLVVVSGSAGTSNTVTYSIVAPLPTITNLTPNSVIAGDAGFQLKVTADKISPTAKISINGSERTTQFQVSSGALVTDISAADIAANGTLQVTVSDNGITSAPATLTVRGPAITSVDPTSILSGVLSQTITIIGDAFLPTSKIIFRGNDQPTTFNADGSLTATLNGGDLTQPGTFAINVRNSANAVSAPVFITIVTAGAPRIDAFDPGTIFAGSGTTTLRVLGTNFVPLSVVRIGGTDRTTTFVSTAELHVTLFPTDVANAGALHVVVHNPDGSSSADTILNVTSGVPPARHRAVRH
jgi:hypothetical protein